jgi:hypothetical protein
MFLILLVLQDTAKLEDVLTAWENAGVKGITILRSLGLAHAHRHALREDIPLIPSLDDFLSRDEDFNRTLFTVTDSEELIDRVIEVTEAITGDLDSPNSGLLVVLPVARARGLHRKTGG